MEDEFLIRISERFDEINSRIDAMQKLIVRGAVVICAEILLGNAVLAILILTRT
jgi:hypothetical protein